MSLLFLSLGLSFPVTHHITIIAGLGALTFLPIVGGSAIAATLIGAVFGMLGVVCRAVRPALARPRQHPHRPARGCHLADDHGGADAWGAARHRGVSAGPALRPDGDERRRPRRGRHHRRAGPPDLPAHAGRHGRDRAPRRAGGPGHRPVAGQRARRRRDGGPPHAGRELQRCGGHRPGLRGRPAGADDGSGLRDGAAPGARGDRCRVHVVDRARHPRHDRAAARRPDLLRRPGRAARRRTRAHAGRCRQGDDPRHSGGDGRRAARDHPAHAARDPVDGRVLGSRPTGGDEVVGDLVRLRPARRRPRTRRGAW